MVLRSFFVGIAFASALVGAAVAQTADEIELVQEALDAYDSGDEDGIFGPRTMAAVKRFQGEWDVERSGLITPDLMAMLAGTHAKMKPQWTKISNMDCQVWTKTPQPREVVTWSGSCVEGKVGGSGTLVRSYLQAGETKEYSYIGAYQGGKRHGHGIAKFSGGDQYDGEFRDGKKHGRGVYSFVDGDRFEGDHVADKRHGTGTYAFADGDKYEGDYRDGEEHGHGVYTYADGDKYDGEYVAGQEHGAGVFTFADGGRYEGPYSNGAAHGRGIFTTASGKRELRNFENGCSPGEDEDRVIGVSEDDCKF